ncbi:Oxidoreductase [Olavius algarvensis associated proteobacterium Delta 3]|nr:Oxidoreductase [Olavius algarvensis associated proteobacterium Delta 3]CAB5098792.1 Oxidoreductase [Olavius algarvensis associated proteobacterium Delta 3]
MKYRRLGRSGLQVSELSIGTMNFGGPTNETDSFSIIDTALEAGINLFDCADVYADGASEKIVGKALLRDGKRKNVIITTKAFLPTGEHPNDRGNSRHHLIHACEKSLGRLNTDYIDIFFLHRTDWNVPQEETLSALDYLVTKGYVRYVACSTHPPWRTVEALHIAEKYRYPKFICEQPPYNLLDRRIENEIVPMCRQYDLGIMTWSPLAQGMLAGRYRSEKDIPEGSRASQKAIYAERITDGGIAAARNMDALARQKEISLPTLAVSWVLHQPGVSSVIIGPRTEEHLGMLLPSVDLELTRADLETCDTIVPPGSYVSNHFNTAGWRMP